MNRANNKLTSRCGGFCALCDPELSTYRTTSKRHLLSGRDLDDRTTSRRRRGTHELTEPAAGLLHARIAAREGVLNCLDVPCVLGPDLWHFRAAVLAETRPSGS